MELLKGVVRKSVLVAAPAALFAGFMRWEKLPVSILAGTLFGILNLKGLVMSVHRGMGTNGLRPRIVMLSMVRLLLLFAAVFLLLRYELANVFGLLFGFTVVFIFIILEGFTLSKRGQQWEKTN